MMNPSICRSLLVLALVAGALCAGQQEPLKAVADGARGLPADWAFQPIKHPLIPDSPGAHLPSRNPIDAFIQAGLAEHNLEPSPKADKRTLLRRVCFDLI